MKKSKWKILGGTKFRISSTDDAQYKPSRYSIYCVLIDMQRQERICMESLWVYVYGKCN